MRRSHLHAVPTIVSKTAKSEQPKRPYLIALSQLGKEVGEISPVFSNFGQVRSIRCDSGDDLFPQGRHKNTQLLARAFLRQPTISNALGLRYAKLVYNGKTEFPSLGSRLEFKQVVKLSRGGKQYRVRGGFVHVFVDKEGKIFQVNSTVRHGSKPSVMGKIISKEKAVERAKAGVKCDRYEIERAELVFSAHNDRLDPVWEVVLATCAPRRVFLCLVKGKSGKVVYRENRLRTVGGRGGPISPYRKSAKGKNKKPRKANKSAKGNVFLRIPDPNQDLLKQIHDVVIARLPNPKVLKNDNLVVYLGNKEKEVKAKADGTFLYKPSDPEFGAVLTFFAFDSQMELMKSWGLVAPEKPIPVYVDDPDVSDNAYFDPESYTIHLGKGSGSPFGLAEHIAYDLGVTWHENGHHLVYLQTPGKDLPGTQGGGIHESIGDVLGDLLMDFWFRHIYGKELGHTLTAQDVGDDPRIIGSYASPPDGIRIQKNSKRTPDDETGEPHDDGLISGGAKADLLVDIVSQANTKVEDQLAAFGKLTLAALALVPSHKVTFQDLLQAYLSADEHLNSSANKQTILNAFANHGIKQKQLTVKGVDPIIVFLS